MKNIPKEIYLNLGIPKRVFDITRDDIDFKELNGVSWSTDKIDDQDLKFVLSGVSQQRELLLAFKLYLHEEYGEQLVSGSIDSFVRHITEKTIAESIPDDFCFEDENGTKVTVIGYVNDWALVEDINHKKPYCLPFEYVKNIYDEMLENEANPKT